MQRLALPALCLMLAACQPIPQEAPYPGGPGPLNLARCGGDQVEPLIGQPVSALPATGGWGTLRVIWPGMPVTEDYSSSRLNVDVNAEGRISGLWCG